MDATITTEVMAGHLEECEIVVKQRHDGRWQACYEGIDSKPHYHLLDAETHDDAIHEAFALLCENEP